MELTNDQEKVLNIIAAAVKRRRETAEKANPSNPDRVPVLDLFGLAESEGFTGPALQNVLNSLEEKHLIRQYGGKPDQSGVELTEDG